MLTHLSISNYAIAKQLDLNFGRGMTVITGETGAGKSITLDALGLTLGDRSDSNSVGVHGDSAEIHAGFDIEDNAEITQWLQERDLAHNHELLLRRVIFRDGKSRAYINGRPATLQDLKMLGAHLVEIHGQHDHQSLLKRDNQRKLLDTFAKAQELSGGVAAKMRQYRKLEQQLRASTSQSMEQTARAQLLRYQVDELALLALAPGELAELEHTQVRLAQTEEALASNQRAMELCCGDDNGASISLHRAIKVLEQVAAPGQALNSALQLLYNARIQLEEAEVSLKEHADSLEFDDQQLQQIEARLSQAYQIARKHRVQPSDLPALTARLQAELASIDGGDDMRAALEVELKKTRAQALQMAQELTTHRRSAAAALSEAVNSLLSSLRMQHCRFQVALLPLEEPSHCGLEEIEFRISTDAGREPQPLGRIASGGELSRVGLAIQVATTDSRRTPTMIFDEVDAGIGGGVAEVVGNLLRELGKNCQVICITHLAQVACKGHHHFVVAKHHAPKQTSATINSLDENEKVAEIARMLGGIAITEQTRAHAREMLATQH